MDRPPFYLTEQMGETPRELIERINRLLEDIYRTKEDRAEFQKPDPAP